jgi:hypothetical protein
VSDLLLPLEPPREDVERPVGAVRGDVEGLGAGLDVWCGPSIGWRSVGAVLLGGQQAGVYRHRRRLLATFTFDLGEAPPLRRHDEENQGEEP